MIANCFFSFCRLLVIKTVLVPTLDDNEVLLLTREHVLSGSHFDSKRTDTLKKTNPRKYLFVKLLNSIRQSSTFKSSVDAMMTDIAAKIVDDDVANSGQSSSDNTPTDDDPESKEPLEEETTEPKKKDKVKNGGRQAKALKELQINGSFGFNNKGPTTTTTTSCPYNFRGIQQEASGGGLSNSAANQKSQKFQPADSKKTPKKPPAPKPQKKLSAKKTSKVKTPSTQKSKTKPSPAIDLEDFDEEEEKPLRGRASRSSKTLTILPAPLDVKNTKLLEEINQATEAARREIEDLRREKAIIERERKDQLKREQQNNLKKRTSKTKNCYKNCE